MNGLSWALVAVGVLVVPALPAFSSRGVRGNDQPGARASAARASDRAPALVAAAATVACIVVLGPVRGSIAAAFLGPAVLAAGWQLRRRAGAPRADRSVALTLDLAAAALRSGRPLGDALSMAAPAAEPVTRHDLLRVAGLLQLGADAQQAWSIARDGPLASVAVVAIRSAASGIRLAAAFERTATEIRADCSAAAAARAQRAGVSAMAPLAACFLPSFVCLGVLPVIIGIAQTALGVLR